MKLGKALTFQWDEGNRMKNELKHFVSKNECEEVFFNNPRLLTDDKHSHTEKRYYAVGKTKKDRILLVVFTLRNSVIRVISARGINDREKKKYLLSKYKLKK